ncbi:MAG: DUF5668 domain-containing protein [candidate division WOR-3 bacterium]
MRLRKGSVWLGVIFILLGILFMLKNLGLFSESVWSYLWKFWPLILILIGLEILISNRILRGIIVLMFLLGVIFLAIRGKPVEKDQRKVVEGENPKVYQFVVKDELKGVKEIEIKCENLRKVDIKIDGVTGNLLSANLKLMSLGGNSITEDSIKFDLVLEGTRAILLAKNLSGLSKYTWKDVIRSENGRYEGTLEINVPHGVSLKVENINGDLTLTNFRGNLILLDLVNGGMVVENVNASGIELETVNGGVTLKELNVDNKIKINSVNGKSKIENVKSQEITYDGVNGDIEIGDDVEFKNLDIELVHGDVKALVSKKWLEGRANISNIHGKVILVKKGISEIPLYVEKGFMGKDSQKYNPEARVFVTTMTGSVEVK